MSNNTWRMVFVIFPINFKGNGSAVTHLLDIGQNAQNVQFVSLKIY